MQAQDLEEILQRRKKQMKKADAESLKIIISDYPLLKNPV
jgi:hypothetical protein